MTEGKKKRGRPSLPITTKLERSIEHNIARAILLAEAIMQGRGSKGRRPKHALDQALVEGWADARRRGKKSKQAFMRKFIEHELEKFIKRKHGGPASPEEVDCYVRRLDRERRRLSSLAPDSTALDRDRRAALAQITAEMRRLQTEARNLIARDGEKSAGAVSEPSALSAATKE
jgi:hypothetical protein